LQSTTTCTVRSTAGLKGTYAKEYEIGTFKPPSPQPFAPLDELSREWAKELDAGCSILIKRGTNIKVGTLWSILKNNDHVNTDLIEYKRGLSKLFGWPNSSFDISFWPCGSGLLEV
jgi:hypothetical protein